MVLQTLLKSINLIFDSSTTLSRYLPIVLHGVGGYTPGHASEWTLRIVTRISSCINNDAVEIEPFCNYLLNISLLFFCIYIVMFFYLWVIGLQININNIWYRSLTKTSHKTTKFTMPHASSLA